jgi:hypothetical protein
MILGVSMLAIGVLEGGPLYLLAWLGVNFCILAVGHIVGAPAILGKNRTGGLSPWSWLVFLPLHLYTVFVWHAYRILSTEPAFNRVDESLIIGRRLLAREVSFTVASYIDLTSEFPEPRFVRGSSGYVSYPILDGSIPKVSDLNKMFSGLKGESLFIHCAQGHGRTGLVAAAYLVFSGKVADVDEAISLLQRVRPRLRLSIEQKAFLKKYEKEANEAT